MNSLPLKNQRGAVLLLMSIALMLASSSYLLSRFYMNHNSIKQQERTRMALAKARQALIDYAVTYYQQHSAGDYGVLPCPELRGSISNGRQQTPNCGAKNINAIGRLPWYSLGLPPLVDGSGECLWYAVSAAYKYGTSAKADMLNADTPGMFRLVDAKGNIIAGHQPEERPVALVIAPGKPLAGQSRSAADINLFCHTDRGDVDIDDYLESYQGVDNTAVSSNMDAIDSFIMADAVADENLNDQIIALYSADIFRAIQNTQSYIQRMDSLTRIAARCLANYGKMQACVLGRSCIDSCNTSFNVCLGNTAGNQAEAKQCRLERASCLQSSQCDRQCQFPAASGAGLSRVEQINLPRPAAMNLQGADYRIGASYRDISATQENDIDGGLLGRYMFDVSNSLSDVSVNNIFEACGALQIHDISPEPINMVDPENEYRRLWNNWKDHLFYVVGRDMTSTHPDQFLCDSDCPTDGTGNRQAAIVWFAMPAINGQRRLSSPPEIEPISVADKSVLENYLELENGPLFPDAAGNKIYQSGAVSNDIAYCIADDMRVSPCP